MKIVIVDYGMGNLGSIFNMFKKVGVKSLVSGAIADIETADQLVLPGVGAFDNGMRNLEERLLIPVLNRKVIEEKTPILGICLGMQLLSQESEEGTLPGLGWIDAQTRRFRFEGDQSDLKIPHMGWNIAHGRADSALFGGLSESPRFYFVHSYHVVCRDEADVLATTNYGGTFTSAVARGNVMGVQFHPEKSHRYGMALFQNFAALSAQPLAAQEG